MCEIEFDNYKSLWWEGGGVVIGHPVDGELLTTFIAMKAIWTSLAFYEQDKVSIQRSTVTPKEKSLKWNYWSSTWFKMVWYGDYKDKIRRNEAGAAKNSN